MKTCIGNRLLDIHLHFFAPSITYFDFKIRTGNQIDNPGFSLRVHLLRVLFLFVYFRKEGEIK